MAAHEVAPILTAAAVGDRARLGRPALLTVPYAALLSFVFGIPFAFMVAYSLGYGRTISGQHYVRLVSEPVYAQVFLNTAVISALVTLLCIALGYPLALFLAGISERRRHFVLALVLVPFWTSILVRSYAWLVLLQQQGVINRLLLETHIISEPVTLVHNLPGVLAGMTYVLLPFMVLSIYAALRNIDESLPLAAASLGANRLIVFWRVLVPLSRSGLFAGSFLVFVLSFGFFITPALLGGLSETTVGMVIDAQMNRVLDWNFGAAIAVALTLVIVGMTVVAARVLDPQLLIGRARE